jgi:hypothetical protein
VSYFLNTYELDEEELIDEDDEDDYDLRELYYPETLP